VLEPTPLKLLLDESLPPSVAEALATTNQVDARHVRDYGLLSSKDSEVLDKAFAEDRILVTSNIDDFVELVHSRSHHAGIVLIERAGLRRDEQLALIRAAIARITRKGDIVNRLLWVAADGTISFESVPSRRR